MQQMVVCPKCGAQNAENSQYCLSCGFILNNNCFNCGAILDPSAKFCSTCGSGVGWALKIKDLQNRVSQSESNILQVIGRNSGSIDSQFARIDQNVNNYMMQYANQLNSQQTSLNDTVTSIKDLMEMEHKMATSRRLYKIGLGLIAAGLAVVLLSYVISNAFIGVVGVGITAFGLALQLVSSFMS
jgi:ribosomal protein L40E